MPLWNQNHYTPGREVDSAVGIYYNFGKVGPLKELAPMLTFLASDRRATRGTTANPGDSGYTRFIIAPGGEIKIGIIRAYGDIEVPVFQNIIGNQITAPILIKLILSYSF